MKRAAVLGIAILNLALAVNAPPVSAQATPPTQSGTEAGVDDLVRAILVKEMIRIVDGNIKASDRESGEINKLIRALSGVSVKDIEKNGICGGTNSEVRKLLGSLC